MKKESKKKYWLFFIPEYLRKKLSQALSRRQNIKFLEKLKKDIFIFYRSKKDLSREEEEILKYLGSNPIDVYPYNFPKKYLKEKISIFWDTQKGMNYVMHYGKRLYFKRGMSENAICSLYVGLLKDQDDASPHKYLSPNFSVNESDVIIDAGAAEGNFSLDVIDKVKKIYLFEADPDWIDPLKATFEPWKNKVEIIQKYISNKSGKTETALDDFYIEHPFTFIKADIEGDEMKLLQGAAETMKSAKEMKIAICTYHKQNDFKDISSFLKNYEFKLSTPPGYMLFHYDKNLRAPFFRRGLIRASKNV